MYVTRRVSELLNERVPAPEGPNCGYLVISDDDSVGISRVNWRGEERILHLPIPQNKDFNVCPYNDEDSYRVIFIPVLNQPFTANRYYVINRQDPNKGDAERSSKEDEKVTCCWGECIQDVPPHALHPFSLYQQFEIIEKPRNRFQAKSVSQDGIPPAFLRNEWKLYHYSHTRLYQLHQALGCNSSLRSQLPDFNYLLPSQDRSQPLIVGNWYCPFMFVKENNGKRAKDKMRQSIIFYEMTLEQRWVKIFSKENTQFSSEVVVNMEDAVVMREAAKIGGTRDAFWDEKDVGSGFLWFTTSYSNNKGKMKVEKIGLSMAIVERMKWEEERVGWVGGSGNQRIQRVDKFEGNGMWKKFSCYMLMETFVLKTMDGRVVLTYDYNHTHQIRSKWE